jgi:ABC-type proline/glycine betaine transport system permease subunit
MDQEEAKSALLIVFLIFEFIAFVLSVFGNAIVCYVMIFKKNLSKPSMKYILSTTIADLLAGLIAIPIGVAKVLMTNCFEF